MKRSGERPHVTRRPQHFARQCAATMYDPLSLAPPAYLRDFSTYLRDNVIGHGQEYDSRCPESISSARCHVSVQVRVKCHSTATLAVASRYTRYLYTARMEKRSESGAHAAGSDKTHRPRQTLYPHVLSSNI